MKVSKKFKGAKFAFLLVMLFAISIAFVGCGGVSVVDPNETENGNENTEPQAPTGFVKVVGDTVAGDTVKFQVPNGNKFDTGVFITGRTVEIKDFYMCDHEVTQEEFEAVRKWNPSYYNADISAPIGESVVKRPVDNVKWYQAIMYCNELSIKENLTPCYTFNNLTNPSEWGTLGDNWDAVSCDFTVNGYRLPTEAEWEYAARGGKEGISQSPQQKYSGSDDSSDVAWAQDSYQSGDKKTHQVKMKSANSLNLYDMSGNVKEWCWDWYSDIATDTKVEGPDEPDASNKTRIVRGGCCNDNEIVCSVAYRFSVSPDKGKKEGVTEHGNTCIGFRVVRTCTN